MAMPSLGAKIWVQLVKDFGKVVRLIPEEDREDVLRLMPILWSGDPNEIEAATLALYETIDDPRGVIESLDKIETINVDREEVE